MPHRINHPAIHDLLRDLGDLERRAADSAAPRMATLREAVAHLRATVGALEDAQGSLEHGEGAAPRRRASELEAEELGQALLRSVDTALAALDLDGTVLHWNPAAERLLGWAGEQVAGRPFPGVDDATRARMDAVRAGGAPGLTAAVGRPDGETVEVEMALAPLVDTNGRVRGTSVHLSPVREEEEPEEEEPPRPGRAGTAASRSWSREESLDALLASPRDGRDALVWIREWVASGVHLGYLGTGDRLPSIRQVAGAAGLDHRAVSLAYRTLAAEGMVEIRDRHGVHVAPTARASTEGICESAEWLCGVLAEACTLRVRAALLPNVVRRWTSTVVLRCACVESSEDDRAILAGELRQQWGLDTFSVAVDALPTAQAARRREDSSLTEALRGADLAVTTPFHEPEVRAAAASVGIPVVSMHAGPDVVSAAEEQLRRGTLTAVVADPAYGRRLRLLRGAAGERLRVVLATDADAVAALDPAEPVLLTRAAQELLPGARMRLLVPVSPFLCASSSREIAEVIVRRNMDAERGGGGT